MSSPVTLIASAQSVTARLQKDLKPGYWLTVEVFYDARRQQLTIKTGLSLHSSAAIYGEIKTDYELLERSLIEMGEEEYLTAVLVSSIVLLYDRINGLSYEEHGDYPHIRTWWLTGGNILATNKPIPFHVFPRWNAFYPDYSAVKSGGVETKNFANALPFVPNSVGEKMATTPAGPLRKIKRPNAVVGNIKKPVCPMHKQEMVFDPSEGLWNCPTNGCKIFFRPAMEHDTSQTLIGKGKLTVKHIRPATHLSGVAGKLFLVSDDNIALDISQYVTLFEYGQTGAVGILASAKVVLEGLPVVSVSN